MYFSKRCIVQSRKRAVQILAQMPRDEILENIINNALFPGGRAVR